MCELVGKADLLSDHFDSKQSREPVDLLVTCHPSPSLITFAFRSSDVKRLLLDLDPYGGTDPLGMFPLFLKRTVDVLSQCGVSISSSSGQFPCLLETGQYHPNSKRSVVILCYQLLTNFHNTSIVQGV